MESPKIPLQAGEPIVCPSGLKIAVREMLVSEERLLADKRLHKSGLFSTKLLEACVVDVLDPGPYQEPIDWRKVLQGDRFVALIAIRVASYDERYDFSFSCPTCSSRVGWRVDLANDLEIKACPEESLEAVKSGEPLEVEIGGARVFFTLPRGADEERAAKEAIKNSSNPLSTGLRMRIARVEIDGEALGRKALNGWISNLSLRKARELRSAFDRHDCGVETEIEVECKLCNSTHELELPLGRGFWMPDPED